ncbi:hypothetical protein APY04_2459 [Hyphomicrobium sulfonivorans]|uniref:Uncharacterized protein n=1 Tax=Hyphomicrobium sulfonivorans TaxID=121290 RepID=A0A109BCH5_HYPSL|nr:hypothetical protein [Hyphomicrobium sulfonivorans]KWT66263.1 hypothetical protein APY04_2459 [Hyphomicrobium sulfonivorans]
MLNPELQQRFAQSCADAALNYSKANAAAYAAFTDQVLGFWSGVMQQALPPAQKPAAAPAPASSLFQPWDFLAPWMALMTPPGAASMSQPRAETSADLFSNPFAWALPGGAMPSTSRARQPDPAPQFNPLAPFLPPFMQPPAAAPSAPAQSPFGMPSFGAPPFGVPMAGAMQQAMTSFTDAVVNAMSALSGAQVRSIAEPSNPMAAWLAMFPFSRQAAAWPMAFVMMQSGVPRSVAWPTAEANAAVLDAADTARRSVQQSVDKFRREGALKAAPAQDAATPMDFLTMMIAVPLNIGTMFTALKLR